MTFKRIWTRIKDVAFLAFILFSSFYIGLALFAPETLISLFGIRPYVVQSDSMKPVFSRGDIILVRDVSSNELEVGDVVAVNVKGVPVAHYLADQRVDEDNKLVFRTRAHDAQEVSDWDYWTLNRSNIMGKIVLVIPLLGHLFLFLKTPIGALTLGIELVLVIAIVWILRREERPEDEKT